MPEHRILGPDGRPVRKADLTREIADARLTGLRQAWTVESVASTITPQSLASTLRAADAGDVRAFLTLAEEMEEREPHYRSVLGTRKRAVTRLPITVEAASDATADVALADEVRALVRASGFRSMLAHMLDGLGKGFSAVEINWDTAGRPWIPRNRAERDGRRIKGYAWRDPRWFRYDRRSGSELRLLDESAPIDGLPLPPYRFLIHEPELKSGLAVRSGLARVACVSYMAKSYTLKDWLAFAEVFGMPIRVGKYGRGASEEDIATLVDAVANIGTDAAAVIPESMLLEFVETGTATGHELFRSLAEWSDRQVSKAVLGQTMTSDDGSSLAQAKVHDEVRDDIRDADAEELADTLNRDLVGAYLALNHGIMEPLDSPTIVLRAKEVEDLVALSDALARLVPLGLRVEASVIRDKFGLPDPAPGAELLGATVPTQPRAPGADLNRARSMSRGEGCPCCGEPALNRATGAPGEGVLDELEEEAAGDWEAQLAPVVDPVVALVDEIAATGREDAAAFEELVRRLPETVGPMDAAELIERLAVATFKARGYGDAADR